MNVRVNQATPDGQQNPERDHLRAKLNLHTYLKHREVIRLGNEVIHCELYEHSEGAPTILFLPGIGTYTELYGELLCKLSKTGFNVVGIDLPGHGYSGGSRGLYTVDQVCEVVSQVVDHLQTRFSGKFAVYGYSIGALLGVSAAEHDDRLEAVLCGTLLLPDIAPDFIHQMGWQWTYANAFMFPYMRLPLRMFVDFEQLLASHPAGEVINNDPMIVFDYPLKTLSSAFSRRCGIVKNQYSFKAAIIHGDRDEVLPLVYSERVVRECQHPFELLVMENASHMVPWLQTDNLVDMSSQWFLNNL
ncbi:MAG: alpha/beta hydrolase [Pontibacterium sp.]